MHDNRPQFARVWLLFLLVMYSNWQRLVMRANTCDFPSIQDKRLRKRPILH